MTRICVLLLSLAVLHACSDGNGAVNPEAERLTPVRVVDTTLGPAAPAIRTSGAAPSVCAYFFFVSSTQAVNSACGTTRTAMGMNQWFVPQIWLHWP